VAALQLLFETRRFRQALQPKHVCDET
jgi:hypothetical protein